MGRLRCTEDEERNIEMDIYHTKYIVCTKYTL